MNIIGCALQYCYIKFMLKMTKLKRKKLLKTTIKANNEICLKAKLKKMSFNSSLKSVQCLYVANCRR